MIVIKCNSEAGLSLPPPVPPASTAHLYGLFQEFVRVFVDSNEKDSTFKETILKLSDDCSATSFLKEDSDFS